MFLAVSNLIGQVSSNKQKSARLRGNAVKTVDIALFRLTVVWFGLFTFRKFAKNIALWRDNSFPKLPKS